jgi:putative ABC transport system substrate-binding protein
MQAQTVTGRLSRRAVVGGLAGLGASAAGLALVNGCSLGPFAGQPRVARIGAWKGSPAASVNLFDAFRDGLREAGWVEGQNLVIDYGTIEDHPERISEVAAQLVALNPEVLVAGSTPTALALAHASDSIPIVITAVSDPVGSGLIASYASPGRNVTGTSRTVGSGLGAKRLDLLRQLMPGMSRVAVVFESTSPFGLNDFHDIQTAAQLLGIDAQAVGIASPDDVEPALVAALAGHPQALLESGGVIIPLKQPAIIGFAIQHGLPSSAELIGALGAGVLMYYGPDISALYRRAGNYYVDRILRGAKPADLPVEGPTVFGLIVNRTTARALGIAIPPEFAAQVTEWVD